MQPNLSQTIEAEQSVLGAMLIEPEAVVEALDGLSVAMFTREVHRMVWQAVAALHEADVPVDLITVSQELKRRGQLEETGGMATLSAMVEACPSTRNVASYIKPVRDRHIERQLLLAGERMASDIRSREFEIDELLERSEKRVLEVSRLQLGSEPAALCDLVQGQRVRILEAARNPAGARGTPSGFCDLDRMTNGFKPSELITVAGCSSMGKSALASQIAFNALRQTKRPVLVFSLEMSKEQWIDRMVSSEARIEGHRLRNGRMSEAEWRRLDKVGRQIMALPMHIIDTPAMTSGEIKAQSRRLRAIHGTPALVVIDYLQIAEPAERQKEERLRVTQMVRDFKNLARHLEAPVLCLSQLSRGVNQRENKRPMLSDLRETSAIEAESDVVLFVYRPSYYQAKHRSGGQWEGEGAPEPDEIIVGKQRNGPTGVVPVKFVAEFARFESLEAGG